MTAPLTIVIDSRETLPLPIARLGYHVERHGLEVGDYAWRGDCEAVRGRLRYAVKYSVERKSIEDFVHSWCINENKRREIMKLHVAFGNGYAMPYIVIGKAAEWMLKTGGVMRTGERTSIHKIKQAYYYLRHQGCEVVSAANATEAARWVAAKLSERAGGAE